MKYALLFSISLIYCLHSIAQGTNELDQADSIYRLNGVKARILMSGKPKLYKLRLDLYDRKGRRIEVDYIDTTGTKFYSKTTFQYDSTNKLVHERSIGYYTRDSNTHKPIIHEDIPDSSSMKIEYDELNRLARKYRVFSKSPLTYEALFSYDPLTIKEKYLSRDDSLYKYETTQLYDAPNISKRLLMSLVFKDTLTKQHNTYNLDYNYENLFDEQGKLIKRTFRNTETILGTADLSGQVSEKIYQYSINGLLIKVTSTTYKNGVEKKSALLFDYKYW